MVTPVNPPPLDRTSPPQRTDAWRQPADGLSEGVRVRVLRAVYGDQRAAAELLPRLTDRQLTGTDPLPAEPAELAPALLREHRAEIRTLPDDTRLLLLLAAADQYPVSTDAFLRAVVAARLDTRCLDAAEAAGIAHAGAGGVAFRDAWTRIAAYETGTPADRRDVHRLLARVLRGEGETPSRSWHRGAGALGPSGRLAAELSAAAGTAADTGRLSVARTLAERAAALCPDPAEQHRLTARAAAYAWRSGDGDRARRLASTAADDALSGVLALRAGNATEAFDALLIGVGATAPTSSDRGAPPLAAPASVAPCAVTPSTSRTTNDGSPSAVSCTAASAVSCTAASAVSCTAASAVSCTAASAVSCTAAPAVSRTATPADPRTLPPADPRAVTPAIPRAVTPAIPRAVTPAIPRAVTPAIPRAVTPA
ncbi:LuxR family transcriptional regulator, partial [Streptomyces chartreusis]